MLRYDWSYEILMEINTFLLKTPPLDTLSHILYTYTMCTMACFNAACFPPLVFQPSSSSFNFMLFSYSSGHILRHALHQKIKGDYVVMDESENKEERMRSMTASDSNIPNVNIVNLLRSSRLYSTPSGSLLDMYAHVCVNNGKGEDSLILAALAFNCYGSS